MEKVTIDYERDLKYTPSCYEEGKTTASLFGGEFSLR